MIQTQRLLASALALQGDHGAAQSLYEESLAMARMLNDKELMASCLEGLAGVVVAQRAFLWAAQLWGAAEVLRDAIGTPLPSIEGIDYERAVVAARTRLGEKA